MFFKKIKTLIAEFRQIDEKNYPHWEEGKLKSLLKNKRKKEPYAEEVLDFFFKTIMPDDSQDL